MRGPPSPPWFDAIGPVDAPTPLVCAVAHAGRHYPAELLRDAAVPLRVLEELEDRHADLLAAQAVAEGARAIVARMARAWIDLNRGEADLDPALRRPPGSGAPPSARARSGLGLLPRRIGHRALWTRLPDAEDAARRIAMAHRPYHMTIAAALDAAKARHGFAVLLDCHSMPPLRGMRPAQIVIGDRHGRCAGAGIARALQRAAIDAGFPAALNEPYAGAYSVDRHGRPGANVHAIQIEVDRSLYLLPDMRTPVTAGVERIGRLIAALGQHAIALADPNRAIAAE